MTSARKPVKATDVIHNDLDQATTARVVDSLVLRGDISALTAEERTRYYVSLCEALGLNPATQPFAMLRLNGKEVLYPTRGATDQLAAVHRINREIIDGPRLIDLGGTKLVYALCRATHPNGRVETATATVPFQDPVNVLMKCECVPLDSEILTREGWKTHDQLRVGEEVLAYDTEKDQSRWTPLENVSVYASAPIAELHTPEGQFSVRCTPNHSWAVRKPGYRPRATDASRGPRGAYANRKPDVGLVEARQINTTHRLVLAAPECETEQSVLDPIEAAILGWTVTDGTIQRRGGHVRLGICQSKEENFGVIRETVTAAAGGPVNEVVSAARARTFPTGRTYETLAQHWWYLPAELSRSILKKAGFDSRADLPRIVTRLAPKARAAMLQAMMLAEGDARGRFANGDRHVLDAFEILCALQGVATGALEPHSTVFLKRMKKTRHVAGSFLSMRPAGEAPVWCPTTRFGTWVMRQNGRVMITGNTKAKRRATLSILGLAMLDETELETIPAHAKSPGTPIDVPGALPHGEGATAALPAEASDPVDAAPAAEAVDPAPPAEPPPSLATFYEKVAEIELPGEAVNLWIKFRPDLAGLSREEREVAWKVLCKRTEEVGGMKNAKVWLKKAIGVEDARRAKPDNDQAA